jgi:hypothetical protein
VTLVAKVAWGEDGQEFEIKKSIRIIPKDSPEAKTVNAALRSFRKDAKASKERVVKEAAETERLVAAAAFVPVRIYVAPYSTLRAYAGTTTNWLYVVAVGSDGSSKIVSAYTLFTLNKRNVISFPYQLYNANHGNFRAGNVYTTVTVGCRYPSNGTLTTSKGVTVIPRP